MVTRFRFVVSGALVLGLLALGMSPSAAAASDTSPPSLLAAEITPGTVSVSGFGYVPVVVRLHLTDATGVESVQNYNGNRGENYPFVELTRTSGTGQVTSSGDLPPFALTSGTAQDGWWSTTLYVTAGYSGTFTLTRLMAYDLLGSFVNVDPRTLGITAAVTTSGTHTPHLTLTQTPNPTIVPLGIGTATRTPLRGRLTDLDTGAPLAGVTVHTGDDTSCVELNYGFASEKTAADGTFAFSLYASALNCLFIYNKGAGGPIQYITLWNFIPWAYAVSASAADTSLTLGQSTAVTGSTGVIGSPVELQRLVSGSWRTVGTATVRTSGRFTLTATPPTPGNHRYRVRVPATQRTVETASQTLLIGVI